MSEPTDEQRARAEKMFRAYVNVLGTGTHALLSPRFIRAWLAVEAHVLTSHTCPDVDLDDRVAAWDSIARHPFFAACYQTEGALLDAMLAKLDAAHTHTCEPVWRPTTAPKIRAGWEIRSRRSGDKEAAWGIAHHKDEDGDWRTEADVMLTYVDADAGWTYETTAPMPEPEPWPEGLVMVLAEVISNEPGTVEDEARAALDALAARYPGVRAALDAEDPK